MIEQQEGQEPQVPLPLRVRVAGKLGWKGLEEIRPGVWVGVQPGKKLPVKPFIPAFEIEWGRWREFIEERVLTMSVGLSDAEGRDKFVVLDTLGGRPAVVARGKTFLEAICEGFINPGILP